ncbi:glucose/arabinose dehydrogenase [Hydrogenophaga palleronii]|uniref:Glucose/arabinose dehydrogenase n=1 Tax=Hydrogenophaga palleronii TaxID=65655 RepID=A0ABU1WKE7_9BURK|nr:PQQ-dependent sugar dehydrogenase [Hydrogenophaga palleronii]MDR7149741.1 glucose/arabinose dehydrogenase [Hydrogenophaga palleronii]
MRLSPTLLLASVLALGLLSACGGGDGPKFKRTTEPVPVAELPVAVGNPSAMAFLPDGRFVVVVRDVYVRLYEADGSSYMYLNHAAFRNVVRGSEHTGLLDVAVDPDFASNRRLYFTVTEASVATYGTAAVRAEMTDDQDLANPEVIYRQLPKVSGLMHFGSRMALDREGHLFVMLGDRESVEQREFAQDVTRGNGKVVRITTEGDHGARAQLRLARYRLRRGQVGAPQCRPRMSRLLVELGRCAQSVR